MNTKSTPSPASSVPARNSKAHDHQYRQHKTWSTHATCEICGFAVSKSTLFLDQNVLDSQLSAELVKERRNPSVPAPAEDVAIVGFARGTFSHEGRIALLSCNHSQVVPESFTTADRVKCATCFPSPAEPVKVLGGEILALAARVDDGGPFVEFGQSYGELTMVARFNGGTHQQKLEVSDMIVDSCFKARSHAAHLAKIKALEDASEVLLMRMESETSRFPKEEKRNRKGFMDRLRAAMALPSA